MLALPHDGDDAGGPRPDPNPNPNPHPNPNPTPNPNQAALGVSGIDGTFSSCSEGVLRVLRTHKETPTPYR